MIRGDNFGSGCDFGGFRFLRASLGSIEFHCSTGTTTGTKSSLDLLTDSSATQKVGRVTVSGHLGDDMPTRKTIDSALHRIE